MLCSVPTFFKIDSQGKYIYFFSLEILDDVFQFCIVIQRGKCCNWKNTCFAINGMKCWGRRKDIDYLIKTKINFQLKTKKSSDAHTFVRKYNFQIVLKFKFIVLLSQYK